MKFIFLAGYMAIGFIVGCIAYYYRPDEREDFEAFSDSELFIFTLVVWPFVLIGYFIRYSPSIIKALVFNRIDKLKEKKKLKSRSLDQIEKDILRLANNEKHR